MLNSNGGPKPKYPHFCLSIFWHFCISAFTFLPLPEFRISTWWGRRGGCRPISCLQNHKIVSLSWKKCHTFYLFEETTMENYVVWEFNFFLQEMHLIDAASCKWSRLGKWHPGRLIFHFLRFLANCKVFLVFLCQKQPSIKQVLHKMDNFCSFSVTRGL